MRWARSSAAATSSTSVTTPGRPRRSGSSRGRWRRPAAWPRGSRTSPSGAWPSTTSTAGPCPTSSRHPTPAASNARTRERALVLRGGRRGPRAGRARQRSAPARLLHLLGLVHLLRLLRLVEPGGLGMTVLVATHDLAQVLLGREALLLHLLEDLAPALATLLLHRDLVEGQGPLSARRAAGRLGLEEGPRDLLLAGWQLRKGAAGGLRQRARRERAERDEGGE